MSITQQFEQQFRRSAARLLPGALFLLLLASAQPAAHASNYIACPTCGYQSLAWSEGEFEQVHLIANGAAAGNLHPQTVAVEGLSKVLLGLRAKTGGGPLLNAESAASLARGLSAAFAKATPQQDALFLVTSGVSSGLFTNKLGSSGRAFMDKNGLNLIFAEIQVDFVNAYRGTKKPRAFEFGNRNSASGVVMDANGMSQPRNDWLIIPAAALRGGNLQTAVPAAAPAAALAAAAPQPVLHDEQYYAAQEMRLKGLKRLRDQNLINEEEYQAKKAEILKTW